MLRSVTLVVALILSTAAIAQTQVGPHSETDEDACDRDAHRLCKDLIPDQMRVLACLQTNRQKLSKACQVVLQSHGV
jgi:type II secretory pathway component PulL